MAQKSLIDWALPKIQSIKLDYCSRASSLVQQTI